MEFEKINVSQAPNDGNGDPVRTAFNKTNSNFEKTETKFLSIDALLSDQTNAASRKVGLRNGEIPEYTNTGISGLGYGAASGAIATSEIDAIDGVNGFYNQGGASTDCPTWSRSGDTSIVASFRGASTDNAFSAKLHFSHRSNIISYRHIDGGVHKGWQTVYSTANTTRDSNGFLKGASPVVDLYSDHVELNAEAELQDIDLEVLGVGDYLITGSLGFAKEGWYVEQPKDANGNVLVAVVYEQLENNDISIKTFKKKFDLETASIVADLNNPTDIPEGRFISVRLQELPPEEVDAPDDFEPQLTGLSEAVAKAMSEGLYEY